MNSYVEPYNAEIKANDKYSVDVGMACKVAFEALCRVVLFSVCALWPAIALVWKLWGRVYYYF